MKTTVELPEALLRAWKKRAVDQGTTLKDLWESVLSSALRPTRPSRRAKRKIRWVTAEGGLPPGLDISSRERMWEWFRTNR
jgi:hypothetical protein